MIFYDFYYGILVERIFLWFLWFFTCHICGNGFCSFLFQSLMVFMVFMIFMILNFLFMSTSLKSLSLRKLLDQSTFAYWALLDLPDLTGLYWALLGLTGPYWALLSLTGPYWALIGLSLHLRTHWLTDSLTDERTLRLIGMLSQPKIMSKICLRKVV